MGCHRVTGINARGSRLLCAVDDLSDRLIHTECIDGGRAAWRCLLSALKKSRRSKYNLAVLPTVLPLGLRPEPELLERQLGAQQSDDRQS